MEHFEYFIHVVCALACIQTHTPSASVFIHSSVSGMMAVFIWTLTPIVYGLTRRARKPKTACYSSLYIYNAESAATIVIITAETRSHTHTHSHAPISWNLLEKFCAFNWKFTTSLILVGVACSYETSVIWHRLKFNTICSCYDVHFVLNATYYAVCVRTFKWWNFSMFFVAPFVNIFFSFTSK